jgi:hypothetical protein
MAPSTTPPASQGVCEQASKQQCGPCCRTIAPALCAQRGYATADSGREGGRKGGGAHKVTLPVAFSSSHKERLRSSCTMR